MSDMCLPTLTKTSTNCYTAYGVAQDKDYDDLLDIKLTKDGFGLYQLNGYRILVSSQGENILAVYTSSK